MNRPKFRIAIGVLLQGGRIWIQRRSEGEHLAHRWEFPGGKIEADESPGQGLRRELREEVGLDLDPSQFRLIWQFPFSYPERDLTLFFFLIRVLREKPAGPGHWVQIAELENYDFPEANRPVLDWVRTHSR